MVLMVDDDPDVRTSVARGLRHSGFDVRVAATGKEALRLLSNETHDALVLDVQMPELDGVAVVTALRALGNDIPICVLSARDTVNDRIAGLEAGADDYLTKPFDLGELVARLHALLRRSSHSDQSSDTMTVGPLTIDTARRLVFVDGERVDLTKREFDLLAVLAENAGVVLSRQRLLELVWGYDFDVDTNVADVFISYLRRKLERDGLPRVIHTVRGIGYVLRNERASRASSADARDAPQFGRSASLRTRVALAAAAAAAAVVAVFTVLTSIVLANNDAAQLDRRLDSIVEASMYPDQLSDPRRGVLTTGRSRIDGPGGLPARLPAACAAAGHGRPSWSTASTTGCAPSRWNSKAAC